MVSTPPDPHSIHPIDKMRINPRSELLGVQGLWDCFSSSVDKVLDGQHWVAEE